MGSNVLKLHYSCRLNATLLSSRRNPQCPSTKKSVNNKYHGIDLYVQIEKNKDLFLNQNPVVMIARILFNTFPAHMKITEDT